MAGVRRPSLSPFRHEDGFTIIEVLVAAVVLLIGIMGVLGIVVQADGVSTSNRAREQGVALQREVVEAARAIPYDQLSQNSIVSTIQAMPGLADSSSGSSGWTVMRRNITYTISVGTCAVDDSNDGTGPHESAGYCKDGTGSTTPAQCLTYLGRAGSIAGAGVVASTSTAAGDCGIDGNFDGAVDGLADTSGGPCTNCSGADTNPNDYKRIVVLVRWNRGLGTRYALQSTTVPNPGLSAAPAVSQLTPTSLTTTSATSLSFTATMSFPPATVLWYTDGTARGNATGSLTTWNITWNLGTVTPGATSPNASEVLDGTYLVSAKGFDAYGQAGSSKYSTVTINRRAPYPPSNPRAGRNGSKGYIEWGGNAERDVEGYRVFRVGSPDQDVCGLVTGRTRCVDTGIPAGSQQYYVQAIDRDSSGNARFGDKSVIATVPLSDTQPLAPTTPLPVITAAKSGSNTVLSWRAATDSDPGDSIQYYRIYRDGTDFVTDLYDRTATGSQLTYTDNSTGGDIHTYYVVAVDQSNVESDPIGGGVTK